MAEEEKMPPLRTLLEMFDRETFDWVLPGDVKVTLRSPTVDEACDFMERFSEPMGMYWTKAFGLLAQALTERPDLAEMTPDEIVDARVENEKKKLRSCQMFRKVLPWICVKLGGESAPSEEEAEKIFGRMGVDDYLTWAYDKNFLLQMAVDLGLYPKASLDEPVEAEIVPLEEGAEVAPDIEPPKLDENETLNLEMKTGD